MFSIMFVPLVKPWRFWQEMLVEPRLFTLSSLPEPFLIKGLCFFPSVSQAHAQRGPNLCPLTCFSAVHPSPVNGWRVVYPDGAWCPQNGEPDHSYPRLCLRGTGGDSGGVAHRDRLRPFPLLLMEQQAHWKPFWATALTTYTSCFSVSSGLNMAGPMASSGRSLGMTLVLPAVFSRQQFSSNDPWRGCPA